MKVQYCAHVQDIGWQGWVEDGAVAGTTGRSLRMEAIKIRLIDAPQGMEIKYRAHVQDIGWQGWVENGAEAGTTGRSLRMEALEIVLTGNSGLNVKYRGHVQDIGWQGYVENGTEAGTTGRSLRMEAVQIELPIKWDAKLDVIRYDMSEPPSGTTPVELISYKEYPNDSDATLKTKVSKTIAKESAFTFGLQQSLTTGLKVSIKADVPFLASTEAEASVEIGLQANQEWSKTVTETYEVSEEITIPPRSYVKCHSWMDWADDVSTDFELEMWVTATAERVYGPGNTISAEVIEKILEKDSFFSGEIKESSGSSVLVSLKGTFKGSYGVKTYIATTSPMELQSSKDSPSVNDPAMAM
ncbi:MAG: hypothetical protein QNK37_27600 [Acidobacteriota bacterium]|nr:hypothetical protein [Acidobacteriota bacterium]